MAAAAKTVAKAAKKKASGKAAKYRGVVSRKDISVADPDLLVIVDTPGHPLYQPARNQKPLDEAMIRSIMQDGVLSPIKVVRGPQVKGQWTLEVVYGRQRVRNAREANRRLILEGRPPIMIEIVIIDASPEQLRRMMEVENTHRTDYTPYELATTASESLNRGISEESVCYTSFKGDKASMRRHLALLRCHPDVQRALIEGAINFKAIDSLVKLPLDEQAAEVSKLQAAGLSGPREVRARLIEDHPDMAPANPADEEGEEGEGEEEAPKAKPIRARNAGEMAARLAVMEATGDFRSQLDKWAQECGGADLDGCDGSLGSFLALILPAQYFGDAESLASLLLHEARRQELRWALRDDAALDTASAEDLGGWVKPRDTKAEKAAESAAKKEAVKAEKAAAKERAKADKIAAREQAKQEAKDAKEAEKARVQAEKEAAAAKRAAKKQSKTSATKQVTIEAAIAPKVNTRQGAQGRGRGRK